MNMLQTVHLDFFLKLNDSEVKIKICEQPSPLLAPSPTKTLQKNHHQSLDYVAAHYLHSSLLFHKLMNTSPFIYSFY